MTRKGKSKRNHYSHNTSNKTVDVPLTQQDLQQLTVECLQIHEILQTNSKEIKQSSTCHLLSKKWLTNWKTYVGYDNLVKQDKENDGKIGKGVGKKHPGKINQSLTKSNNGYITIPPQLKEYQYLNKVLNDKLDKDEDYMAVTDQLWSLLIQRYEVSEDIVRPVRKTKNHYFYDAELASCDIMVLDYKLVDSHMEKYKKINKKDRNVLFDSKKIQFSTIWQIEEFETYIKKLIGTIYMGTQDIEYKIWRVFNYLNLTDLQEQLSNAFQSQQYILNGRPLEGEKYKGLDMDQIIKPSYTLLIQLHDKRLSPGPIPDSIKGYCEECLKQKQLVQYCMCQQFHYCSTQCRITDQIFHRSVCSVVFDSEDDEKYDNQKIKKNKFIGCGLNNLGNTCYMNSTLQCIVSIQEFRQFYGCNSYKEQIGEDQTKLNMKMSKFIKQLDHNKNSIYPWNIKGQVNFYLPPFRGYKQHDANDFLTNFVNVLNETLKHSSEEIYHPIFKDNLLGYYQSTIQCPDCHVKIQSDEMFMQLSVPIKEKSKKILYNYVIVTSKQYRKGRAQIKETWLEVRKNLKISQDCILYASKEGQSLFDVDEKKEPQRQIKSLKNRQLIAYPQVTINQSDYLFEISTVTIKSMIGTEMKSQYGYPHLLSVDAVITTMVGFYVRILQYFGQKQLATKLSNIQKEYFLLINQTQSSIKQEESTNNSEKKQRKGGQNQLAQQLAKNTNDQLQKVINESKVKIFLHDLKKHKNICSFCKKRCEGCVMKIRVGESVQEYFNQKLNAVNLTILLPQKIQKNTINNLNLCHTGEPTLQDCLQLFKQPEQLDEENAWYCQNCDMMRLAFKQMTIKSYPSTLIIQLNRFKSQGDKKIKNNENIDYGQVQRFGQKDYKLIGVIIHEGSIDAGHYWAICWRAEGYYIYNDDKVHQTDKVVNKSAYILFYKQI